MSQGTDARKRMNILSLALMLLVGVILSGTFALLVVALMAGGSAGGTLASGRSVTTYSDALTLSSQFSGDTATIRTAGKTIVVAPTKLIIDGKLVGTISSDVSTVEVHVRYGTVKFVTDGKEWPATR